MGLFSSLLSCRCFRLCVRDAVFASSFVALLSWHWFCFCPSLSCFRDIAFFFALVCADFVTLVSSLLSYVLISSHCFRLYLSGTPPSYLPWSVLLSGHFFIFCFRLCCFRDTAFAVLHSWHHCFDLGFHGTAFVVTVVTLTAFVFAFVYAAFGDTVFFFAFVFALVCAACFS